MPDRTVSVLRTHRRDGQGLEAARAAERVTRAEAGVLQSIVADMHAAVSLAELLRYSELNARLHATIRDIAAHETSARLLRQLRDQTVRHQFSLSLVPGRPMPKPKSRPRTARRTTRGKRITYDGESQSWTKVHRAWRKRFRSSLS